MNYAKLICTYLTLCACALLLSCAVSKNESVENLMLQENSSPQSDKHFLWKVFDEDSFVWVLGSLHFGDTTFYPMDTVIENAFYDAEELAVEINVNNDTVSQQLTEQRQDLGTLPDGVTLQQVLPEEMWKTLDSICSDWSYPIANLMKLRPWNAATMLSSVAIQRTGIDASMGVDAVLLERAESEGKRIVEIETASEQIGALAGKVADSSGLNTSADTTAPVNDEDGIYYLHNTLREISKLDSIVSTLITAWKTGNDSLLNLVLETQNPSENSEVERRLEENLYTKRNEKMADAIAMFLKENRNIFIVVGVAHLALNTGNVIELLENRGYKLQRF